MRKAIGYYRASGSGRVRNDDDAKTSIGRYARDNLLQITDPRESEFRLNIFSKNHGWGKEYRTNQGWIKLSNVGAQIRENVDNHGNAHRWWDNQEANFSTQNTLNNQGDSTYAVTTGGYRRIAPINITRDLNQVNERHTDRHVCYMNLADARTFRGWYDNGVQNLIATVDGTNATITNDGAEVTATLTAAAGRNVVDFTIGADNNITRIHVGHAVII